MEVAITGGVFLLFYVFILFGLMAFSILAYVLQSLGLHTIANRRGIKNGWLAWIPVGNMWIMGSISDQYQYVVHGKVTNRRKILLGTFIAYIVVYVLLVAGSFMVGFLSAFAEDASGAAAPAMITMLLTFLYFVFLALSVVMAVFQYIALYDLFCSCERTNGVLYLVLSIFVSVVMPFLVFACRKKDDGMPPRRSADAQVVVETVREAVVAEVPAVETPVEEAPAEEGFAQPEEFVEE